MPPTWSFCATARLYFRRVGTDREPGKSLGGEGDGGMGFWDSALLHILLLHQSPPTSQVLLAQDVGACSAAQHRRIEARKCPSLFHIYLL